MAQEFISYSKKSKDFRYSHLKVPSQKVSGKEEKCYLHTDEFSGSKLSWALLHTKLFLMTLKQNFLVFSSIQVVLR